MDCGFGRAWLRPLAWGGREWEVSIDEIEFVSGAGDASVVRRSSVRVPAVRLRRGDQVNVRGVVREVTATRVEHYASGDPAVVVLFTSGPSLRVHAGEWLTLVQDDRRHTQQ